MGNLAGVQAQFIIFTCKFTNSTKSKKFHLIRMRTPQSICTKPLKVLIHFRHKRIYGFVVSKMFKMHRNLVSILTHSLLRINFCVLHMPEEFAAQSLHNREARRKGTLRVLFYCLWLILLPPSPERPSTVSLSQSSAYFSQIQNFIQDLRYFFLIISNI